MLPPRGRVHWAKLEPGRVDMATVLTPSAAKAGDLKAQPGKFVTEATALRARIAANYPVQDFLELRKALDPYVWGVGM